MLTHVTLPLTFATEMCTATAALAELEAVGIRIGKTQHLTAYRVRSCADPAPAFADVVKLLPKTRSVTSTDGGLRSRMSRQCVREAPTRAVNGTGCTREPGRKKNQSDDLRVVVK